MPNPTISTSDRRTAVVIVGDAQGWTIYGVISGVVVRTPVPLSARVAAEYLRAWLPEVLTQRTSLLAAEITGEGPHLVER
jgi:hypothetical protein